MNEHGQAFEMSNTSWKLSFDVARQVAASEDRKEEEGAAAVENPIPDFMDKCTTSVEVLKVPDTDKFCVKFSRKAGSAMLFYDSATKYMDLLSICNNASLGEEEE